MPLQTSGAISLQNIQTQFGGSNPISISEYYAGGGLVPSGTTGINGAIPSSGTISFSQFYGAPQAVISLPPSISVIDSRFGGTAQARVNITSAGEVLEFTSTNGDISLGDWIDPVSAGTGNYEVRASGLSGDTPGGTFDTWLNLGTNRQWTISRSSNGTSGCSFTLEIRPAGGGSILATSSVSLDATVF
jgi:hypothetical protein